MLKHLLLLSCSTFFSLAVIAQGVKIGDTPGNPHATSVLELESETQGFLPPRMTYEQRDAIVNPAEGLRIFNTDSKCENFFNGSSWVEICGGCEPQPTSAYAGPDQSAIIGTEAILAANTPGGGSAGLWTIISNNGGSFSGGQTSTDPAATFTGVPNTTYVLRWRITSACGSTQDDVSINFACAPQPTTANGGADQLNVNGTSLTLSGNPAGEGSIGTWYIVQGVGGNFEGNYFSNDPNATFYGTAGASYILQWRMDSEFCGISTDNITVSFLSPPSVPCSPATQTDFDNNVYNTVQIGSQCWFKENLRTTHYADGSPIEYPEFDYYGWTINTTGAYSWYNSDVDYADDYGALYNGYAVTNPAGLCPVGWRVPSATDWNDLSDFLGGNWIAGGSLKATSGWDAPNAGATDYVGFSGNAGGYRLMEGSYAAIGVYGWWWSTEETSGQLYTRLLKYHTSDIETALRELQNGLSVRCIRD